MTDLKDKIDLLCKEKTIYENKIIEIKQEINNTYKMIYEDCIKKNGSHEYERVIETGPYPSSYFVCKKCGYEY
tara:strand:+ start:26822 stop:27040 length:219 start_codon:yes stop_codon:yes gene_type:complete